MKKYNLRWALVWYDIIVYIIVYFLLLFVYGRGGRIGVGESWHLGVAALACIIGCRILGQAYYSVLRYGGVGVYLRLFMTDGVALLLGLPFRSLLNLQHVQFSHWLLIVCMNLLGALGIRLVYRYSFRYGTKRNFVGQLSRLLLKVFAGTRVHKENIGGMSKIRIAIIGAGRLGAVLANELLGNDSASYLPVCFVDGDKSKQGRSVLELPVYPEGAYGLEQLKELEVQEVVFAITELTNEKRDFLYKFYRDAGYKIKTYDFPMQDANQSGKRALREISIEELLFRQTITVNDARMREFYKDKVILITGGGGSIGSELCRQLAKLEPKQIVILDIYENGVYDVQQELRLAYKGALDLRVEICSITNKMALGRVFEEYHPQIVINAAAHKHVPLMEKNCIEAVENNVFGTVNVIECCEEYGTERFMMVSTDKAVNPTNVMGATKRMCEIVARAHSVSGTKTTFSATRFGNVLGSAGSVIPLFKRQIANGGPVTLTDKRIIRYFMTIPEASQLVLASGAMAKNGELFVLDMGQPVKILDLAENMIRLSGLTPYKDIEIVETGLRPGEKLYEELLVKSETLTKTDNNLIFIEKDEPITMEELQNRLSMLEEAVRQNDDEGMRAAMHKAVPTYHTPEEVNNKAAEAEEMQNAKKM